MSPLSAPAALSLIAAIAVGCAGCNTATQTRDVTGDRGPRGARPDSSPRDAGGAALVPAAPDAVVHKAEVPKKARVFVRASARGLAVDATHLYYGDVPNDGVYAIPKTGGEPVRLARRAPASGDLALDGATLTWIASPGDAVLRVMLQGSGQPITLRDRGIFADVATGGGDVFIIEAAGAGGVLTRITGATASRIASFDLPPRAVIADATHAYVVTPTKIFRAPHAKGEVETIATGSGFAHPLLDEGFLYVVSEEGATRVITRVAKTGGPTTAIARDVRDVPFEIEGGEVLFFDAKRAQVRAVRVSGGEARVVVEDDALHGSTWMVADATTVFVATAAREGAAILAIPRH